MNQQQPETPAQREARLRSDLSSMQERAAALLGRLSFADVINETNQAQSGLGMLAEGLARARARGYTYWGDLEGRLEEVRARAPGVATAVRAESQRAGASLRPRVDALTTQARKIAGRGKLIAQETALGALRGEISGVDSAIDDAEKRLREVAAPLTGAVAELRARVDRIHWTLDHFEKASFKMQPEENPLFAVKATWEDGPGGEREGLLLFTDHRVRFEQHEEKVLERTFLVFASKTETVRTLLLDEPLGHLTACDDAQRGWLMKDELLTLGWRQGSRAPVKTTFELGEGTAKEWDAQIEMLRAGDVERARYRGAVPQASLVGVPVRWPSECAECGAALKPPVKGQTYITCEYCRRDHDVVLGQG